MNVWLSALLVLFLVSILFLLIAVLLVWGVRRLYFREIPSSGVRRPSFLDQPRLPEWFIRVLTAVWPTELIFACILVPSVTVVVWSDERNLVQLLGIAVLVGAVAYVIGLIGFRDPELPGCVGGWFWAVLVIVFAVYYVIVALICRHIILPVVFRIAGLSGARIPSVFGK